MDIERKWFDADASAAAEVAAGINGGSVGVGDDDNDESGDTDNSCYDDNSCIVSKNGLEWFPYFGCFVQVTLGEGILPKRWTTVFLYIVCFNFSLEMFY